MEKQEREINFRKMAQGSSDESDNESIEEINLESEDDDKDVHNEDTEQDEEIESGKSELDSDSEPEKEKKGESIYNISKTFEISQILTILTMYTTQFSS
jgi:hypothetical protein